MVTRRHMCTAARRGRRFHVLVSRAEAIGRAIRNDKTDLREAHLATRLRETVRSLVQ